MYPVGAGVVNVAAVALNEIVYGNEEHRDALHPERDGCGEGE
jgi:hypothetical protein